MQYPIPTHLKKILIPTRYEDQQLIGNIRCTCGCNTFALKVYADMSSGQPCVCEKNNGFAFAIGAVCTACSTDWLLLDFAKHGYDGFVCKEHVPVMPEELVPCQCPKCGGNVFCIETEIEVEDKTQFLEECVEDCPDEFKPEDYVDAFGWIVMNIHCRECGCRQKGWVDLELS